MSKNTVRVVNHRWQTVNTLSFDNGPAKQAHLTGIERQLGFRDIRLALCDNENGQGVRLGDLGCREWRSSEAEEIMILPELLNSTGGILILTEGGKCDVWKISVAKGCVQNCEAC